jgi:hypothetical protein
LRKEIRTLNPEVLLRHLPGQSGERDWHLQRIDHLLLGGQPLPEAHGLRHAVLRMELPPRRDVAVLSLLLAVRRRADALAIAGARVRNEPAVADPAWT